MDWLQVEERRQLLLEAADCQIHFNSFRVQLQSRRVREIHLQLQKECELLLIGGVQERVDFKGVRDTACSLPKPQTLEQLAATCGWHQTFLVRADKPVAEFAVDIRQF